MVATETATVRLFSTGREKAHVTRRQAESEIWIEEEKSSSIYQENDFFDQGMYKEKKKTNSFI